MLALLKSKSRRSRSQGATLHWKQRCLTAAYAISDEDVPEDRVAVITGGTSRFGAATAIGLAQSGKYDKVIIIGRSDRRAKMVLQDLKKAEVRAEFIKADLSCLHEVRAVCQRLRGMRLQCLVCAAGATALPERLETVDRHEYHFGLNFLSRFAMVNCLLEDLISAGTLEDPARVLLVGSDRQWGAPVLGFSTLGVSLPLAMGSLHDLQLREAGAYGPWKAFGQAALSNVMFAYELQRRLRSNGMECVAVSCFDPGPMDTAWESYRNEENRLLCNDLPDWLKRFFSYFTRLIEKPEVRAATPVLLATTSLGTLPCTAPKTWNAGYFEQESPVPSKYPVPWSWGTSYDEAVWEQLWEYAAILTKASSDSFHIPVPLGVKTTGKAPKVLPIYAWLWLWWHAPRLPAAATSEIIRCCGWLRALETARAETS